MTTNPPTDRDRIAEALYAHSHPGWATRYTDLAWDERDTYLARASAVLAVLPPAADRGAVLASVRPQTLAAIASHIDARSVAILRPESETYTEWQAVADELRRVADEAQQECPGYETAPNRCTCDCEGCRHNCAAHQSVEARQQPDTETGAVSRQTLVGLIRDFRDPDPCQLDHHGYCQAHVWMCSGSPCPHARAREVLAAIDAEEAAASGPGGVADEEQPETQTVWCSAVALRVHHAPHDWQPQPGMNPVHCGGYPAPAVVAQPEEA